MKRRFRLTKATDFKRVRRLGKSYAHPLLVLVALPSQDGSLRFGISTSRSIGKSTQRNRAKRLIREALRPLLPFIATGWEVIIIIRKPLSEVSFREVQEAITSLITQANLWGQGNEHSLSIR